MADQSQEEIVTKLAEELKQLLQENLLKDPKIAGPGIERARELRDTIQSFGFLVTTEYILNPEKLETLRVNVTLWKPNENMTPEEQKMYDKWFTEVNGIGI
ncbi:MAG: hypothetical protein A3I24_02255 [Candidatus Harrisonbacteria bacterium RIFCSPLOWO2_02_FULL_41_13b]|uniref:Uncharacterized protein n=1 Tax=Candidatus Harrisonbacteria bacterium RIFCSPLOWO2_02_FULL_41_13b TaxID=1798409 RepID=A0A1G1ZUT2_9BACT|nr:MAG: hypothetical protein A3J53_03480 [Candidatus Harrisonbacteria bacterium RIFCSPHIGHO2_02_FULL_40_20]OGY68229.1 MAG: hypothetical protein A3I24_02255 [Candidatus Harrisonbacteria bacterium RIFCSPLOWO2_02_FULL_41_13b]